MDTELKEMVNTYLKDMDNRGDHEARDLLQLINTPTQNPEEKTPAQRLQFHLQFMGIMAMSGREDERDAHYVKAQKIAQQLVDEGF
tara:strand:- start:194 stop:451 length:258 start_codon:yes stop_codon:yes gene_type:complete